MNSTPGEVSTKGHISRILDKKYFSNRVEIARYVLERKGASGSSPPDVLT
jgi:hypothetical protein